ncbi:MAG TPA: haloacid dehalogenase [Anaerolineae bacterium]|nr:haloacid dehalogenase [Anaerolineales bacterium]HRV95234.1 haloacid dehalogenase [Anaerolineae bacterium]
MADSYSLSQDLQEIVSQINQTFEAKSTVRDATLNRSREVIRHCANSIRAIHRGDEADAGALLATANTVAAEMIAESQAYPDVYYAGYTQDALKELAEAHVTQAIILQKPLPTPEQLGIEFPAYLNGLAEGASELRRFALDALRRGDVTRAEQMLVHMDDIYSVLVTVDFSSAITGGLRRTTDVLRGVLERTRGDVTTAVRQEAMKTALQQFEQRIGLE